MNGYNANTEAIVDEFSFYDYNVTIVEQPRYSNGLYGFFCYIVDDGADFRYHSQIDGNEHFDTKLKASNKARDWIIGLSFTANKQLSGYVGRYMAA